MPSKNVTLKGINASAEVFEPLRHSGRSTKLVAQRHLTDFTAWAIRPSIENF
jgi:hypothetical protein